MAVVFAVCGYEMHGNGEIAFDVKVQREVDGGYVDVPSGHRTVVLDAAALATIAAMDKTNAQKLQEVAALIRERVLTWRVAESEDACTWFGTVAPEMTPEEPVRLPLRVTP